MGNGKKGVTHGRTKPLESLVRDLKMIAKNMFHMTNLFAFRFLLLLSELLLLLLAASAFVAFAFRARIVSVFGVHRGQIRLHHRAQFFVAIRFASIAATGPRMSVDDFKATKPLLPYIIFDDSLSPKP